MDKMNLDGVQKIPMSYIDISAVAKKLDIATSGADPKIWLDVSGKKCLLKYDEHKHLTEYVGSKFYKYIGLPVQEVELVILDGVKGCLCYDIADSKELRTLKAAHDSSFLVHLSEVGYTFDDVRELLGTSVKADAEFVTAMSELFDKVFCVDAILANRDRHAGNWGYLVSGGIREVAPVFDNGACLFPNFDRSLPIDKPTLYKLVVESPKSQVQYTHRKKNNFLTVMDNVRDRLDISWLSEEKVAGAIYSATSILSEQDARFFITVVMARYLAVIEGVPFEDVWKIYSSGRL